MILDSPPRNLSVIVDLIKPRSQLRFPKLSRPAYQLHPRDLERKKNSLVMHLSLARFSYTHTYIYTYSRSAAASPPKENAFEGNSQALSLLSLPAARRRASGTRGNYILTRSLDSLRGGLSLSFSEALAPWTRNSTFQVSLGI